MNYLIHPKDSEPFLTRYYEYDNHYVEGMIVYDLINEAYTTNGIDWKEITTDHL